jgi:hypothetical protein
MRIECAGQCSPRTVKRPEVNLCIVILIDVIWAMVIERALHEYAMQ